MEGSFYPEVESIRASLIQHEDRPAADVVKPGIHCVLVFRSYAAAACQAARTAVICSGSG
jgi:hypothetical protein